MTDIICFKIFRKSSLLTHDLFYWPIYNLLILAKKSPQRGGGVTHAPWVFPLLNNQYKYRGVFRN